MLPLWDGPTTTFTELAAQCAREYAARGADLVRTVLNCVNLLNEPEQHGAALLDLNDLSLELSALHPGWMDFSVAVFREVMGLTRSAPEDRYEILLSSFKATLQTGSIAMA